LDLYRTVFIGFRYNRILDEMDFPIAPEDKVLKHLVFGDIEAVIFMGGFAIERPGA